MARTPTMTASEAESLLGPRGNINVTSDNRATVRKWLVAQDFPSLFVGGLTLTELRLAYNQTDGAMLAKLREKLATSLEELPADEPAFSTPAPTLAPTMPKANGHNGDAAELLRDLILKGWKPESGIDAEQVRAIIRAELPNLIPTRRLEIVTPTETRILEETTHKTLADLIAYAATGENVLLVGPAGSGKTTGAEQACKALNRLFTIQGVVDGAHAIYGFNNATAYQTTPFRHAFENGAAYIKDEIDGDDPGALLALNAGLANGYTNFPDSPLPIHRHPDFICIACGNTFGRGADRLYVGRNQLDAATLDRFVTLYWDYDQTLEKTLGASNERWLNRVWNIRRAVESQKARIIVSTRAITRGIKLLNAGVSWEQVEESVIWKGTDSELRRRIEAQA